MRVNQNKLLSGEFWLPGNIENKVSGTLKIENDGHIHLEIVGDILKSRSYFGNNATLGRVLGHVEKEGPITLDSCFFKYKSHGFGGGISKSTISAGRLMTNIAYEEDTDILFNTYSFSVDLLDEWVNISGIESKYEVDGHEVTVSYTQPNQITIALNNGMTLDICFSYSLPETPAVKEAKITQSVFLQLSSETPQPFETFRRLTYILVNFMCFAMDETVSLHTVIATANDYRFDYGNGKSFAKNIKIFFPSLPHVEKEPSKHWRDMLFCYSTIESNFEQVVNGWIEAYDRFAPAIDLYFSSKYGRHTYTESKFLALAQGLETFHRSTDPGKVMIEDEFQNILAKVIEACPDERKEWLATKIEHANELSLGQRLKRIISPFKKHVGNSTVRETLIGDITNTRNYLTHYAESLKERSAKSTTLLLLCFRMEALFQLHLLKSIGFTEAEIASVVDGKLKDSLKGDMGIFSLGQTT